MTTGTGTNFAKIASNLYRGRLALFHDVAEVYKPALDRRKAKLIELMKEKAESASKSELARKIRVAKGFYALEMAPPGVNEIQKLKADLALVKEFIQSGCFRFLTIKQAWLLFLVGFEIYLWFYLGETIGKMHVVGYKV